MMENQVFVNGCFDILHSGHIKLLRTAKKFGHVLVAIDSDNRVKLLKGNNRPINTAYKRFEMLMSLKYVDNVVIFNSDEDLEQIIKTYAPDVMVKGADYEGKPIIGSKYCNLIYFIDLTDDSTTKIIERISNR